MEKPSVGGEREGKKGLECEERVPNPKERGERGPDV